MAKRLTAHSVLREALDGAIGWRRRARIVLGLTRIKVCAICYRHFDAASSRQGITCGAPKCVEAYCRSYPTRKRQQSREARKDGSE